MDWNVFWTAFGAIGTTGGTFATAIAAFLAYRQYSLSKSAKLKIEIELQTVTNYPGFSQEYLVLKFINKGIIDLFVNEIAIEIKRKDHRIENFFAIEDKKGDGKPTFPIEITNKQAVPVKILNNSLKMQVNRIRRENNIKSINYLKFVITDGQGKRHIKRIRYKNINHQ